MTTQHGHILVVDDNRMNRIKLSAGLEQQGHSVALAEHGKQAFEMMCNLAMRLGRKSNWSLNKFVRKSLFVNKSHNILL
jgi:CheY-like chemotaxis protein